MRSPDEHPSETVLKTGPKRTVVLISDARAGRVVKRFHSPAARRAGRWGLGFLGSIGDRRRALAEQRALTQARAAGLPVPRPIAVERSATGAWELSMSAVPGARPFTEILVDAPSAKWAEALGALLRLMEAARFLHADPHPTNLVVDGAGALWIVDVARSRTGASRTAVRRSITRALSRMRELAPRTFRRRVARAWLGSSATPDWTRGIERAATRMRIEELTARVSVWRRTSSATEVRAGLDGRGAAVWVRARDGEAPEGWKTVRLAGPAEETERIWSTLVRAKLHGIPCCEPRALALSPPHAVAFDVPSTKELPCAAAIERTRRRLAASGLDAADDGPWLADPQGHALVAANTTLIETVGPQSL